MNFSPITHPFIQHYFGAEPLHVSEIGDGNLNFIFRIQNEYGASVILKHAPPYLRLLGVSFPLPSERIVVEMHTMCYFKSIAPSYIPKILHCDEAHFVMIMEDLLNYETLQKNQLHMLVPISIYEKLGDFLHRVKNHNPPCQNHDYFENATLKSISDNYIFVYPYLSNHEALNIPSFFKPMPKNDAYRQGIKTLRELFLNAKQTLIHGDLHTGSVMVHNENIAIIDAEFSFFGPLGFDIGTLFAHILFGEIYNLYEGKDVHHEKAIKACWKPFNDEEALLQTSVGFCGAELFRRLVVPAKAKPLEALRESKEKAYHLVDRLAIDLVSNFLHVKSINDFCDIIEKHLCTQTH